VFTTQSLKFAAVKPFYTLSLLLLILNSCLTPVQKEFRGYGYKQGLFAKFTTEKGIFIAKLEFEKTPLTVANFVGLAEGSIHNEAKKDGEPYYNGLKFHRVYQGEMLLGGCPIGDGTGHPGYFFQDEFNATLRHDKPGILSMQNWGAVTNGSQFILSLKANPELDDKHTVFGEVIFGMDALKQTQQGDKIITIDIIRIGKKAINFNPVKIFEENGFGQIKMK